MRKLLLCLLVLALAPVVTFLCRPAAAGEDSVLKEQLWTGEKRDMEAIARVFTSRLPMAESQDPAFHISFRHSKHKGISCVVCHHKVTPERERYTSCAGNAACHTLGGPNMDPLSRFQAIHYRESERSCYGCHFKERASFSGAKEGAKGCITCHKDPNRAKQKKQGK